jgi:cystathionine beta-lyase
MAGKDDSSEGAPRPETDVVHLGRAPFEQHGFVNPPVYRGSTVLYPSLEALKTRKQPYTYGRRATPTTRALEDAIVHLEGGAATILTSSGLGAVSTAILAFVQAGDHILIVDSVYQPAR